MGKMESGGTVGCPGNDGIWSVQIYCGDSESPEDNPSNLKHSTPSTTTKVDHTAVDDFSGTFVGYALSVKINNDNVYCSNKLVDIDYGVSAGFLVGNATDAKMPKLQEVISV